MTAKGKKPGKWKAIINEVEKQLEILRRQGIAPTLRGMHYRLASIQGLGYGNTKNDYKELSKQTARARENRTLSINCFIDKGRTIINNNYVGDDETMEPEDIIDEKFEELKDLDTKYIDVAFCRWYGQEHYVEIWLEKEAQEETFKTALRNREVRIVPNKGYSSLTFIWKNCQRLIGIHKNEPHKQIHIRYFGDFDPSGKDMDRDIIERIELLTGWTEGEEFDFKRIAVEREHIQQYGLPPMPEDAEAVKKYENDPRTAAFEAENGGESYAVELDALAVYAPNDYIQMIQDVADEFLDEDIYESELKKRSSPEFQQEIRQTVYDKTQEFLDSYEV
jgi:hypothetical protein